MKVRVLSLNAGLLRLLGLSVPIPFVSERLAALPGELRRLECDVVLLQEIYGYQSRHWLAESLRDIFPYTVYPRKKRNWGLENGLMALSRFPMAGGVELFRDAPWHEALFDSKGMLITQHYLSENTVLTAVNFHTTAGGISRHPENKRTEEIRSLQISHVLDRVHGLSSPLLIAADLNAGPGVSEVNFRQIQNAGFISLHDFLHSGNSEVTWDPKNSLNTNGPHKGCPPQRIDHIFLRIEDVSQNKIRPLSSAICLQGPVISIRRRAQVTISDHFGICAELDISSGESHEGSDGPTGSNLSGPTIRSMR